MKKLLLILLVALVPAFVLAQNSAVDKLFKKYGGQKGFTTININSGLLKFAAQMTEEEEDLDVLNSINTIKILAQEDGEASNFYDEVMGTLKRNDYEELMTVNSDDGDVIFLVKKNKERISEFILVAGGDDENVLIYIGGDMSMKDLTSLSKSINIDSAGFDKLEHLDELEKK